MAIMKITAYGKGYSRGFFQFWKDRYTNVRNNRTLIWQLLVLSLTQQYKKTLLGSLWLLITPILGILVWLVLHYAGIYNPGETSIPFAGFILLSTSIWNLFISFFLNLGASASESGMMVLEAPFNMEIKLVEKTLFTLVNFAIPLMLNLIVLIALGVPLGWSALLFIPALLPLMILGVAIGTFFSLIEVVLHDVYIVAHKAMGVLMFLTPVVYSENVDSAFLQTIIRYNPLTYLISVPRNLLMNSPVENISYYWLAAALSIFLFVASVHFYFNSVYKIVEKILE